MSDDRFVPAMCTGATCCVRWSAVAQAYRDGRREEAVREVRRSVREEGHPSCRIGARLVVTMISEGEF